MGITRELSYNEVNEVWPSIPGSVLMFTVEIIVEAPEDGVLPILPEEVELSDEVLLLLNKDSIREVSNPPPTFEEEIVALEVTGVLVPVQDQQSGANWSEHESDPATLDRMDSSIPEKNESGQMLDTFGRKKCDILSTKFFNKYLFDNSISLVRSIMTHHPTQNLDKLLSSFSIFRLLY